MLNMWSNTKYKELPKSDYELINLLNRYTKSGNKYSNKFKELRISYILKLV